MVSASLVVTFTHRKLMLLLILRTLGGGTTKQRLQMF
jgi:hypothetical protein